MNKSIKGRKSSDATTVEMTDATNEKTTNTINGINDCSINSQDFITTKQL